MYISSYAGICYFLGGYIYKDQECNRTEKASVVESATSFEKVIGLKNVKIVFSLVGCVTFF